MRLMNFFLHKRIAFLKLHQKSFLPPSTLCRTVKYSSLTNSSNWVHHNQLFQRHPRLQLVEEQCLKTFHHFKQFLSYLFVSGLHRNPFVMSRLLYLSLIELEVVNGTIKMEFGVRIFNQIRKPNNFSWNIMIRFFATTDPEIAFDFYMRMLSQEIIPEKYTCSFLLQACGAIYDLSIVRQVHSHVVKLGFSHDLFVQNSLLNAYMICESTTDARLVFRGIPEKDIVSWTTLISGLVSQSSYGDALHVFKKLVVNAGQLKPNAITMISTMSACGSLESMDLTKCLHGFLEKSGWLELDVSVINSLMDAYAKCGDLSNVQKVFDENKKRDLYSWTSIISGYAVHGRGLDALNLFSQMDQVCGVVPDAVTFVALLSACARSGLIKEGLYIFESMSTKYRIEPDLQHYGCLVDLLGRAGMLERAFNVVENMPMKPNLAVLGSLLSACTIHNNLEFGEAILRKIELLKERGGAPVLLSNIYANENQWSKVMYIRKEMRGQVKQKSPGRSWIQVKDTVDAFVARKENFPQARVA